MRDLCYRECRGCEETYVMKDEQEWPEGAFTIGGVSRAIRLCDAQTEAARTTTNSRAQRNIECLSARDL
jgi:hypothetical protein